MLQLTVGILFFCIYAGTTVRALLVRVGYLILRLMRKPLPQCDVVPLRSQSLLIA